jgi:tRNA acetyltransferase TAN1
LSAAEYDFNLLVSCPWGWYPKARAEIARILTELGDKQPKIQMTLARGIIGVKTCLDSRSVIRSIHALFEKDSLAIQRSLKWAPIDYWTTSDMESIKEGVVRLRGMIEHGETWRMTVEKRRYTAFHAIEIIREAAELIDEKVDLKNPKKIVRIELIGGHAGISVLKPEEVFSAMRT